MIFYLFGLPTPALLGAFVLIAILRLSGIEIPEPHPSLGLAVQVLLGLYIGVKLTREVFKRLYLIIKPVLLTSVWSLSITIGIGYLLFIVTGLDMRTAILGASPAGAAEMSIIAYSIGADVAIVGLLQIIRLSLTLVLFPLLTRPGTVKNHRWARFKQRTSAFIVKNLSNKNIKLYCQELTTLYSPNVIWTIVIALTGGCMGYFLNLPAGWMLGALLLTAISNFAGIKTEPPLPCIRILMQVGIGIIIGFNFSQDMLFNFQGLIFPIIIFSVLILLSSLVLSRFVQKMTGWEKTTCYLATAPGGLTPMVLLADELNYRPLDVSMLQLARLLTIKCIVPFLVLLF